MDDLLKNYESWLHRRAYQLNSVQECHDDLVQEGRIAMWQAYEKHDPSKGALSYWLTQHATWRMKDLMARGGSWRGLPRRTDGAGKVKDNVPQVTGADSSKDWGVLVQYDPILDRKAEIAYHRPEIAKAIASLTDSQKKYVAMRFGEEMKGAELKEAFGYDPSALWNSKKNGAKYKLREKLAHLQGIYT